MHEIRFPHVNPDSQFVLAWEFHALQGLRASIHEGPAQMSNILTKKEWASLMLVRVSKEPSRALPRQAYMDPAASVMFEGERATKAAARRARREQR